MRQKWCSAAKPRNERRWDLDSQIGWIKTHWMAARNTGKLPDSAWALTLCYERSDELMLAPAKAQIRLEWDLVSLIGPIKTHRTAARKLKALSISTLVLAMQCACRKGMQFSNQSSDAWRSGSVLQSIHTCFSLHPDVMQASTDLIWQFCLCFQ